MRVQTEEWQRFIPGVRMYKGKKTLFYNGEALFDENIGQYLIYDRKERETWEVIIVLPGVEVIPFHNFEWCSSLNRVIMADSVRILGNRCFQGCSRLVFVKLSRNLECIVDGAFYNCALTSIFIPPTCHAVGPQAFQGCYKLIILSVPQHTRLGVNVITRTKLLEASPFETLYSEHYPYLRQEADQWIKNINGRDEEEYALHRACLFFTPLEDTIHAIVKRQGLNSFDKPNSIGITPSQYLKENPNTEIKEQKIINQYILDMMGEIVF
ncbi:hypothetical protein CTEN210_00842 [Chaetoceros tenuissimus]|uniref:Leucine-rich repeat domain-containing protein n=1 Tax=Chaetoceros tenuissimus TaxID=426638 RepID=A0AAD3CEY2_9STRA|nr:hypothetical protein CTEN210_00842 [Chaetoceros tenuissimus]